jgi:integrase
MSVKWKDSRGKYEVRWHEGSGQRSRLFERKRDADAFDLEIKRRKQLGALAPSVLQSRMTLAEFVEEDWWPRYAIPNLADDTRRRYLELWGTHLLPRMGDYELRAITSLLVEDFRDQLTRSGVRLQTVRQSLMLLQGIVRRAVVRGLIPVNPVRDVPKPKQKPGAPPQPLSPLVVERIRHYMLTASWSSPGRGTGRSREQLRWWRERNAMIVSLMAYGGLRPVEDRGSAWTDLQGRTLHVVASKTGRPRDIDVLAPLAQDLAEWRLLSGVPSDESLLVPTVDGDDWRRHDWGNWRRRVWHPAAIAAGVTGDLRPYRLRGSFVSLLLWAGEDLTYVAEQAGHSVTTLARYYAGVIRELRGQPKIPAAEAIRQAREQVASGSSATDVRQENRG